MKDRSHAMDKYEPFSCVDLTALQEATLEAEGDESDAASRARATHGKLLLIVSSRGLELVRIPNVLH